MIAVKIRRSLMLLPENLSLPERERAAGKYTRRTLLPVSFNGE